MTDQATHLRGAVLSFTAEPDIATRHGVTHHEDAIVSMSGGTILSVLTPQQFEQAGGDLQSVHDIRPGMIVPGFIDTHVHYPQMDIIASYGEQLLQWLDNYAFPAELKFKVLAHAQQQAEQFMRRLLEYGTTTALTFTTVHPHSTDALFQAAQRINARMIAGKVLMNRNAPDGLLDKDDGYRANRELLERWHGQDRLLYAVTPRFAITSTDDQLAAAGRLVSEFPDVYVHSHIAEHPDEITATLELFPQASDYTDVYDRYGLLTDHAVYAHGIHLSERELTRMHDCGTSIAFCPSSNLFLGSGLLNLPRLSSFDVDYGIGSDVGGGTSFSLLATAADGYKVAQLGGYSWHPLQAMHTMTRGGARALDLGHRIGSIEAGFEADLVVLRPQPGSMLEQRINTCRNLDEALFAYLFLGTDHAVAETYIAGVRQHQRKAA